jgi:hypothetical protein
MNAASVIPAAASLEPQAAFPSCPANTIIDTSAGSTCTPAYPDSTNSAWRALAGALIPVGGFTGVPAEIPNATDFANASREGCDLTKEVTLEQVQATLNGIVDVGQFICAALVPPDPLAIACYIAAAAIGAAGETDAGLFTDCVEQDGLVNAAEIDAAFHNTVTIYNTLKGVDTHLTSVNTQITNEFTAASTQLTNVNNQITGEFTAVGNQITAVDAHIATEFGALSTQVTGATDLLAAYLKQIMKLELTPDGQRVINPAILTCTGVNCPNVLANCPAAGCSWNNVGPLP